MRSKLNFNRIADDVFEIRVSSPAAAQDLASKLRTANLAEDVVGGLTTVAVSFSPTQTHKIEAWLKTFEHTPAATQNSEPVIEIGIQYGREYGPDIDMVCDQLNLSQDAFIEMHTACEHTVDMMGFTPGFSYISGLPDWVEIPRLDEPRSRVVAGSVGISTNYTGTYALAGPGGWPLIGRVTQPLFLPDDDDPFPLQAGQRIRFKAE